MKIVYMFVFFTILLSLNLFSQHQTIFPAYILETEFLKDQDTWKEQFHEVIRLDPDGYPSEIFTYRKKEDGTYELFQTKVIITTRGTSGEIIEVSTIVKNIAGEETNKETYTADYYGDNKWKVKEVLYEEKSGSDWLPATKNVFEHNDNGYVTKNTSFKYVSGDWINNYFWELFYNGNYLDYEVKKIWNNNQFQNNMKIDYSRDSQQNLTNVSYYNFDFNADQWIEFWREKYYNSSDGYPEYIYRTSYNFINQNWINIDRILIEKNSAESFVETIRLVQKWDEVSQTYIDESLTIGSDPQFGAEKLRGEMDANSSVRFEKPGSQGGGYLIQVGETEDKFFNYDEPDKSYTERKYFNEENNLIEKIRSKMDSEEPISKKSYEYQKVKGIVSRQETAYIFYNGQWLNDKKTVTNYDETGNETEIATFNYYDDEFVEWYNISQTYSGNSILSSEKYFYDENVKPLNEKILYSYSAKGALEKITKLTYQTLTEDYSPHSVQYYSYDSGDKLAEVRYNTFDHISGEEQNDMLINYSYTTLQNNSVPDTIWTLKWNGNEYAVYSIETYEYDNPSDVVIENNIISDYILYQNYPNPFGEAIPSGQSTTKIKYAIPNEERNINAQDSSPFGFRNDNAHATLKVYDVLGKEVATLVNKTTKPGVYEVEFNASQLASGIYFYRLQAGSFVQTKKLLLLK